MSTYNEYLHSDFKRLGFPDYIKMLDGELRLKDMTFLFTRQNLPEPPFFGKYNTEFRFAIVHPPEESGKRPYIGLIQCSLFDAVVDDRQKALVHNQVYHSPVPNHQVIRNDTIQFLENHLRIKLSNLDRLNLASQENEHQISAAHVRKR